MGGFQPLVDTVYPLFLLQPGIPHAYNLFLQIAVDLGIPGLMAWRAVLLVGKAAWRVWRTSLTIRGWISGLGARLLASQVAMLGQGLTDAGTWGMVRIAMVPWAIDGLTMGAWCLNQQTEFGHSE